MANNRMFLVHRPSGLAIALGKRMEDCWYCCFGSENLGEDFATFFSKVDEYGEGLDDFVLTMEVEGENVPLFQWDRMTSDDDGHLRLVLEPKGSS